jgi:hypothetical protein
MATSSCRQSVFTGFQEFGARFAALRLGDQSLVEQFLQRDA